MRATAIGAGVILVLSGCSSTQVSGSVGAASSTGKGSTTGASTGSGGAAASTSGGRGSTSGTTGGTSGGTTDLCRGVICDPSMVCDPNNGKCECYVGGPVCGPTQICAADGGCIQDPCFGVTCAARGAACFGGVCRCGGPSGAECDLPDEACSPFDNSCGLPGCAMAPCMLPGTVCNSNDDQCHCGTISGPICGVHLSCLVLLVDGGGVPLPPGQDAGGEPVYGLCSGDPCGHVLCPPFETCDENNDGACECGGAPRQNIPGVVCASDEACVEPFDGGEPTCRQACQPFGEDCPVLNVPDASVPDGSILIDQGCYFFPSSQGTFCAPSTADAGAGSGCLLPTDCAISSTCGAGTVDAGANPNPSVCLSYCDVFPDGGPSSTPPPDGGTQSCPPGSSCTPLPSGIVAGTCQAP